MSGRKTTPKVRKGKVQKKDRHRYTSRFGYVLDRKSPGHGWRHVVSKRDIRLFVELIPNWSHLAQGLDLILLGKPDENADGHYDFWRREKTGVICLNPWPDDLWVELDEEYVLQHAHVLELLGVSYSQVDGGIECRFDERQAKAYSLVHVFVHELGHHHDRMTTRNQVTTPRGERFAEDFANSQLQEIWGKYVNAFKW